MSASSVVPVEEAVVVDTDGVMIHGLRHVEAVVVSAEPVTGIALSVGSQTLHPEIAALNVVRLRTISCSDCVGDFPDGEELDMEYSHRGPVGVW